MYTVDSLHNIHYRSYTGSAMKQRVNGTYMDGWVDIVLEVSIYNKVATHKQNQCHGFLLHYVV